MLELISIITFYAGLPIFIVGIYLIVQARSIAKNYNKEVEDMRRWSDKYKESINAFEQSKENNIRSANNILGPLYRKYKAERMLRIKYPKIYRRMYK